MKKLLTRVLTLALVLCCFTFVGCTKYEDNDPKPATIEQTLAICDQFIADMQAIQTKISAPDYEYPTTDAQASAKQVADTDKSSMGIEYSNYMDFDYNYDFDQDQGHEPNSPSYEIYPDAVEMGEALDMYIQVYKDNRLQLNNVYSIGSSQYIKLTNNGSKISFSMSSRDFDDEFDGELIINIDKNSNWTSFEYKHYEKQDGTIACIIVEKATNANRVFNRYLEFEHITEYGFSFADINETTQKMLYMDNFSINSMNVAQSKGYNYFETLNISSIADNIDTTNAVEIEVNLGE